MDKEINGTVGSVVTSTNGSTVSKAIVNGNTVFFKSPAAAAAAVKTAEKKNVGIKREEIEGLDDGDGDGEWLQLATGKYLVPDTNINEVEIPDWLNQRVLTGIPWLDRVIGGKDEPGFTPSCVTMLTAVPGGGKTTLMLQMAEGLTAQGHVVLYNTGEESPEQVARTCKRLGTPNGFIIGTDTKLVKLLDHLELLRAKYPGKHIVLIVDSLKTINCGKYAEPNSKTPLRVIKALTAYAKRHHIVVVSIGHVTKAGQFEGKQEVKHKVDAHMHIKFDINPKSPTFGKRILGYQKNRFGPVCAEGEILRMEKHGLVSEGLEDDYQID